MKEFDNLNSLTPAQWETLAETIADRVALKMLDQPRLVSRNQIAVITSMSVPTIDRLTQSGEIPCIRRGTRVLFDPVDVIKAMKDRGQLEF